MPGSQLNSNNFLIWTGNFDAPIAYNTAVNDSANATLLFPTGVSYKPVVVNVLANDTSTYGIDWSSVEITDQDPHSIPATYNPATGEITYYLPSTASLAELFSRFVKYKWRDIYGNPSNEATFSITIVPRSTAWRAKLSSAYCILSGGTPTGEKGYSTLEKYYTDTGARVSPPEEKANDPGDPDYVPPVFDSTLCVSVGSTTPGGFAGAFTIPSAVDPTFMLATYELFEDTPGIPKVGGAYLGLRATDSVDALFPQSGFFTLKVYLENGLSDGVPKYVQVTTNNFSDTQQYTGGTGILTFANIEIDSGIDPTNPIDAFQVIVKDTP